MTIEPKDLREGDRVRITLEGEVSSRFTSGSVSFRFYDGALLLTCKPSELAHAEITRLDPPIRVGDGVKAADGRTGAVKGFDDGFAWVRWNDTRTYSTEHPCDLTRIEGETR